MGCGTSRPEQATLSATLPEQAPASASQPDGAFPPVGDGKAFDARSAQAGAGIPAAEEAAGGERDTPAAAERDAGQLAGHAKEAEEKAAAGRSPDTGGARVGSAEAELEPAKPAGAGGEVADLTGVQPAEIIPPAAADNAEEGAGTPDGSWEEDALRRWLVDHGVPEAKSTWGTARGTKGVADLRRELTTGASSLLLEGEGEELFAVRVVQVVSVRIQGRGGTHELVCTHQTLADGATKRRGRPLSEKVPAGDAPEAAAVRGVVDSLSVGEERVRVVPGSRTRQDDSSKSRSAAFPGIRCRYVVYTVEAEVEGLDDAKGFDTVEQKAGHGGTTHHWAWAPHVRVPTPEGLAGAINHERVFDEKRDKWLEGTRIWMFDKMDAWLDNPDAAAMFWMMGSGGTGKSVVVAQWLHRALGRRRVAAVHFCRHDEPDRSSPAAVLGSFAAMLCHWLPGYSEALDAGAARKAAAAGEPFEMFRIILEEPLGRMERPASGAVAVVIDALDEIPPEHQDPLLDLIASNFSRLPSWVRLVVSSRDEPKIRRRLTAKGAPEELRADERRNREDVRAYLRAVAARHVKGGMSPEALERAVEARFPELEGRMSGQLEFLKGPIEASKRCYDDVMKEVERDPAYRRVLEEADVRPPDLSQEEKDFGQLYADAEACRGVLREVVAREWREWKTVGSTVLHRPVEGTKLAWVGGIDAVDPGVKGRARAEEKCEKDYGGDATKLKDLARVTLECRDCEEVVSALRGLRGVVSVAQVKNKFTSPTPMGYRDLNLCAWVELPGEGGRRHVCEVQVNLTAMLRAKDEAHEHYEKVRARLPDLCKGSGMDAGKLEAYIVQLLNSSELDAAVDVLERKADGLMMYAALLDGHLAEEASRGREVDFAGLDDLPVGIDDLYRVNFERSFPEGAGDPRAASGNPARAAVPRTDVPLAGGWIAGGAVGPPVAGSEAAAAGAGGGGADVPAPGPWRGRNRAANHGAVVWPGPRPGSQETSDVGAGARAGTGVAASHVMPEGKSAAGRVTTAAGGEAAAAGAGGGAAAAPAPGLWRGRKRAVDPGHAARGRPGPPPNDFGVGARAGTGVAASHVMPEGEGAAGRVTTAAGGEAAAAAAGAGGGGADVPAPGPWRGRKRAVDPGHAARPAPPPGPQETSIVGVGAGAGMAASRAGPWSSAPGNSMRGLAGASGTGDAAVASTERPARREEGIAAPACGPWRCKWRRIDPGPAAGPASPPAVGAVSSAASASGSCDSAASSGFSLGPGILGAGGHDLQWPVPPRTPPASIQPPHGPSPGAAGRPGQAMKAGSQGSSGVPAPVAVDEGETHRQACSSSGMAPTSCPSSGSRGAHDLGAARGTVSPPESSRLSRGGSTSAGWAPAPTTGRPCALDDHHGERGFSPAVGITNVVQLAWDSRFRARLLETMLGGSRMNKDRLDMAGKFPLSLRARECGIRPDLLFVDAAQSGGLSGADDGALLLGSTPRVPVYFEVKSAAAKSKTRRTFSFKKIRFQGTRWRMLLLVGRERDPDDWLVAGQGFWLGWAAREDLEPYARGGAPMDLVATPARLLPHKTPRPSVHVRWCRFEDLDDAGQAPAWWTSLRE